MASHNDPQPATFASDFLAVIHYWNLAFTNSPDHTAHAISDTGEVDTNYLDGLGHSALIHQDIFHAGTDVSEITQHTVASSSPFAAPALLPGALGESTGSVSTGLGVPEGNDDASPHDHGLLAYGGVLSALIGLSSAHNEAEDATNSHQAVESHTDMDSPVAVSYGYLTIEPPGSGNSTITAINDQGEVAGNFDSFGQHGFTYDGSSYATIHVPGSLGTFINAINETGEVVGYYVDSAVQTHGYIYDGSTYTLLDAPSGIATFANDINDSGEVAGRSVTYTGSAFHTSGFVYSDGIYTTVEVPGSANTFITDINEAGDVAGFYHSENFTQHAFLFDGSTYTTIAPPNSLDPTVSDLNDTGDVVGYYYDSAGTQHGYLYSENSYTILDVPGSSLTNAYAINDSGGIAGTYYDGNQQHGFVYDGVSYTTIDPEGSIWTTVTSINDAGEVAGYYEDSAHVQHGFIATPPCYCRGTMILTERGELPVEELAIDDTVMTKSGEMRPIKWIGRRGYSGRFVLGQANILPICVTAGALDEGIPRRDLWISPHHAMYLEEVLIEARDLINGVTIFQAERVDAIEYFHIELDSHDVLIAEGARSETFIDDDSRGLFHNAHEYRALYPGAVTEAARYCAPRCAEGLAVERARQAIARRAGLAYAVEEPRVGALHGCVEEVAPDLIRGWARNAANPNAPVCLDIIVGGALIGQVLANRYRADEAQTELRSRNGFEFVPPARLALTPRSVEVCRSLDGVVLPHATIVQPPRVYRAS